jgi:tRNA synthetases class II (D, K and N)
MINYQILADSISFYESKGFKRIESPWTVTSQTSGITKPDGCKDFTIKEKNKVLVASGEQSFLYLYTKGFLPKGMFQTITPCFRDEPFDAFHMKYFLKNELIITDDITDERLQYMVDCAREFFRKYCLRRRPPEFYEPTCEGHVDDVKIKPWSEYKPRCFDLEYEGIELGSYGRRRCDYLEWIFGTGVAEPRLTRVLQKYGISS